MGAKSMLVNYGGYPNEVFNLMPDNGLAVLAAWLRDAGHETFIWDCATVAAISEFFPYDEHDEMKRAAAELVGQLGSGAAVDEDGLRAYYDIEDRIDRKQDARIRAMGRRMAALVDERNLDFVGFKLWTGAGFHGAIILAEEIKKVCPSVPIFGGGPHMDWFMHRPFDVTDAFDVLVYGEGEHAVVELAGYVEGRCSLADVPNAIYRQGGEVVVNPARRVEDLNAAPLQCYDEEVYPAMAGDQKIKIAVVDDSRGCPNRCAFCIHPAKSGSRRRTCDAAAFVDRLEELQERHGFRAFRLAGSNPPVRLKNEIAAEIVRRGLDIVYGSFAHVGRSEEYDFPLLRRAGCVVLAFGVESGSQRILDEGINKRVKVEAIRRAILMSKEAGILTQVSVIVPAPFETEETKEETYKLLCETRPDGVLVAYPALLQGTGWHRDMDRYGFEVDDLEAVWRQAMAHRINHFAPPALWRPIRGYNLNGKDFHQIGCETAAFVQRLKAAGLTTQVADPTLLMASALGAKVHEFAQTAAGLMREGDVAGVGKLVTRVNSAFVARKPAARAFASTSA